MFNRFEWTDTTPSGDSITGLSSERLLIASNELQSDVLERLAEQQVLQSMTEHEARIFREEKTEYARKLELYKTDYFRALSDGLATPRYPLKPGSVVAFEAKVARVKRELLEDSRKDNRRL
jgi:hypothetical protein